MERGESTSPARSTTSPRAASSSAGPSSGHPPEREHEEIGLELQLELGRDEVPELDRTGPRPGQLDVMLDAYAGPVEPARDRDSARTGASTRRP